MQPEHPMLLGMQLRYVACVPAVLSGIKLPAQPSSTLNLAERRLDLEQPCDAGLA